MKTVAQIAQEIGVSKQAVWKRIKGEPLSTSLQGLMTTVDGTVYIEVDGEQLIKSAFNKTSVNRFTATDTSTVDGQVDGKLMDMLTATIDTLKGQLAEKDRQLQVKDQQIDQLMQMNQNSQLLLGQAQKQIAEDQKQIAATEAKNENLFNALTEVSSTAEEKKSWWQRLFDR